MLKSYLLSALLCCAALATSGCALTASPAQMMAAEPSTSLVERYLTGACTFGGLDTETRLHCAQVNFGEEGLVAALNDEALDDSFAGDCNAHVNAVEALVAEQLPEFAFARFYSCTRTQAVMGACHVSAEVTSPSGRTWILDNQALVPDTLGAGGVASKAAVIAALGPGDVYGVGERGRSLIRTALAVLH